VIATKASDETATSIFVVEDGNIKFLRNMVTIQESTWCRIPEESLQIYFLNHREFLPFFEQMTGIIPWECQ
jgi:hypothetical protein